MRDEELAYMSAGEIADKVRRRLLSPVETVDACIARLEHRNPSLNAFVFTGFDDARREPKAAEQAIMSGSSVGPLHGVPDRVPRRGVVRGGPRHVPAWAGLVRSPWLAIRRSHHRSRSPWFPGSCSGRAGQPMELTRIGGHL